MKRLFFFQLAVLCFSCSQRADKEEKEVSSATQSIGKYVYLDKAGVLHIRRHCHLGLSSADGHKGSAYKPITFIDTIALTTSDIDWCCSFCIDDEQYEKLISIAKRANTMPGIEEWTPDKK